MQKQQVKRETLLTHEQEPLTYKDIGKYQIPSDKKHFNGEPYESFASANNKADAETIKRVINELALKYLGVKFSIRVCRFVQGRVFYDLYWHRWAVIRNGKLEEEPADVTKGVTAHPNWEKFKAECIEKIGVF